ncbi:hypothetical protein AJ80_05597 [Polytolypa hystricis UAMH7299]|uniref:F-box domain-containing protein n=1 Tax=Polytolypa hystricis (strain UAMH7299) TaxID=1447883 RepID=A0A2B7XU00_POLH7|nr:hypothetical protein AJ80_05597 [Polytolypa hystricis UAMH7299]
MDLSRYPREILTLIIEYLVLTIGIYKAVQLRLVNKTFDYEIMFAIFTRGVIDLHDPATPYLFNSLPPPLKGRVFLSKYEFKMQREDGIFSAVASVNQKLDELTQPSEEQQHAQHLQIAEAAGGIHSLWDKSYGQCMNQFFDEESLDALDLLGGAIVIGNLPLVQALLEPVLRFPWGGVDNLSQYFGRPLQLAAAWGHLEIVQYLLDHGASPYWRICIDSTSVKWPENRRKLENMPHTYRCTAGTALEAAALGGHEEIVRLLLQPEHCLPVSTLEYAEAYIAAARGGSVASIKLLLQAAGTTIGDLDGVRDDMLAQAVRHNQQAVAVYLLDHGTDVNAWSGCGIIRIAAQQGRAQMARFLIDRGAEIDDRLSIRRPIVVAARGGHQGVVDVLLEYGASLNDAFLGAAVTQPHLLGYLLQKGVDVHAKRSETDKHTTIGRLALLQAIQHKNPRVIKTLFDAFDAGVPLNFDGGEPMDDAVYFAKSGLAHWIVEFLLSLGVEDREVRLEDIW